MYTTEHVDSILFLPKYSEVSPYKCTTCDVDAAKPPVTENKSTDLTKHSTRVLIQLRRYLTCAVTLA